MSLEERDIFFKETRHPKQTKRAKRIDVNTRVIISFREMGKGHSAIQSFCKCMNMPPPMSHPSFVNTMSTLHVNYVKAASTSMKSLDRYFHTKMLQQIVY